MSTSDSIIPLERIEKAILVLREQKVLLDADLAALYQVQTKALVRAVHRNVDRFPADFMFQVTPAEMAQLRCRFGTSSWGVAGIGRMPSPSRALRCYRASCEVLALFKSTSRSCVRSFSFGASAR